MERAGGAHHRGSPGGSNRRLVLIGHSLGGDDVIKLAERLNQAGIPVDLLMPIDPVSQGAVPANVRES